MHTGCRLFSGRVSAMMPADARLKHTSAAKRGPRGFADHEEIKIPGNAIPVNKTGNPAWTADFQVKKTVLEEMSQ